MRLINADHMLCIFTDISEHLCHHEQVGLRHHPLIVDAPIFY